MLHSQLWIHSAITFLSSLAGTGFLVEKNDIYSHTGAIVNSCPWTSNGFQDCTVGLYFLDTELFIVVFPKYVYFSQIPNSFIPHFCLFLNTKGGNFQGFILSFWRSWTSTRALLAAFPPCPAASLSHPLYRHTFVLSNCFYSSTEIEQQKDFF